MKIINKLNLSLGFLLSIGSISITAKMNRSIVTQENCDEIIYCLFAEAYFDPQDKTSFSQLISEAIEFFKVKRSSFSGKLLKSCDEMIILQDFRNS